MAGMTVTIEEIIIKPLKKITFTWVSDSIAETASGVSTEEYSGLIERVVQIPDTGGTIPTAAYDVVVNDEDGTDVLHGNGANLINSAPTLKSHVTDGLGAVVQSTLTLGVAAAGANKGGKTIIYLR